MRAAEGGGPYRIMRIFWGILSCKSQKEVSPMQVHVNGSCIGCGLCVPEVGDDLADQVQAAADACPVSAIEVR